MLTATEKQAAQVNGVDLDSLLETVGAIRQEPELGAARFRATNTWVDGNHNRSTVTGFFGAKQEIAHARPFTMEADEPPILAGHDQAPNPMEHLLHALASCLTTSMVAHAAVRGIAIEELESELEGDIDLNGFLGLDPEVSKGYTEIRAKFRVKADAKDVGRIKALAEFSPVFNTITRGARVDVSVDLK